MNYHIDKNAPEAAYLQLYRSIREAITDGSYRCGDRLPGKRAIAEDAGVSVITAESAVVDSTTRFRISAAFAEMPAVRAIRSQKSSSASAFSMGVTRFSVFPLNWLGSFAAASSVSR